MRAAPHAQRATLGRRGLPAAGSCSRLSGRSACRARRCGRAVCRVASARGRAAARPRGDRAAARHRAGLRRAGGFAGGGDAVALAVAVDARRHPLFQSAAFNGSLGRGPRLSSISLLGCEVARPRRRGGGGRPGGPRSARARLARCRLRPRAARGLGRNLDRETVALQPLDWETAGSCLARAADACRSHPLRETRLGGGDPPLEVGRVAPRRRRAARRPS